ncbi:hypothetical protein NNO04_14065 [Citrobacter sp. Awk 4]|uniref:hypothetical protein n=1 Tax=Citrobacter sp. Awk 4 TaxID=2963955 RepID=UPI0023040252|nr:hypothetical protein [Citrobacter sp. Awk 4]MDA8479822.1 hypothetical protein [Citrobacter sp. Awk 4]
MIRDLLMEAINHERMLQKLNELNTYFYNRKHETQIRDELVVIINQISPVIAISEYPKLRIGAVDLSLYESPLSSFEDNHSIATIELKHHYPRDLLLEKVQNDILSDISRTIVSPTTHFLHIIQQRDERARPLIGKVKYLERNARDISPYVKCLEELSTFPRNYRKESISIEVQGDIMSTYTFNIYTLSKMRTKSTEDSATL